MVFVNSVTFLQVITLCLCTFHSATTVNSAIVQKQTSAAKSGTTETLFVTFPEGRGPVLQKTRVLYKKIRSRAKSAFMSVKKAG